MFKMGEKQKLDDQSIKHGGKREYRKKEKMEVWH